MIQLYPEAELNFLNAMAIHTDQRSALLFMTSSLPLYSPKYLSLQGTTSHCLDECSSKNKYEAMVDTYGIKVSLIFPQSIKKIFTYGNAREVKQLICLSPQDR